MKGKRHGNQKRAPAKRKQSLPGSVSTSSTTAVGNEQFIEKVDENGRTHYAVPLKGPRHKEGQPYLIAHYSMPPPAERDVLIDKLAKILAEAMVNQMFEEAEALHGTESSPLIADASGGQTTPINTPGTKPRRTQSGRKAKTPICVHSEKNEGCHRSR